MSFSSSALSHKYRDSALNFATTTAFHVLFTRCSLDYGHLLTFSTKLSVTVFTQFSGSVRFRERWSIYRFPGRLAFPRRPACIRTLNWECVYRVFLTRVLLHKIDTVIIMIN